MTYVLGADVSKYQDNNATPKRPDFVKLKEAGCKFVIIRASQNVYIDEDFTYNWKAAKDAGLIRGSYHFHEYRQGIAKPTLEQAKFYASVLGDDPGDLPPAVDYERPNDTWPELPPKNVGLANLEIWYNYMDQNHKKGIFYTNPNTILYNLRPNITSGAFLLQHPLWIAQYFYKLAPNGQAVQPLSHCNNIEELGAREPYHGNWSDWTIWQFGTPSIGLMLGMESREIDMDVFKGSEDDLRIFCGISKPVISDTDKINKLWEAHPELH